jgi:homocysteine S-methyltransferase
MLPSVPFLERLRRGLVLADGAMGTMLHQLGAPIGACFDRLSLDVPDMVLGVHRAFLEAGAELIETNTFGANRFKLAAHNLDDDVSAINRAAVTLAQQAVAECAREVYVAGSVGPLGVRLAPLGRIKPEQAFEAFYDQIEALVGAGVQALIFETFSDVNEIMEAVRAARAVNPNIPVITSMTFTRDGTTTYGDAPRDVTQLLSESGADVIGVNCSSGPSQLARIAQIMRAVEPDVPIAVMPNAGFPEQVGGRIMYPATPDYFGEYALVLRDLGVSVLGGCCGTTPDHIRAMREALADPRRATSIVILPPEVNSVEARPSPEAPTNLAQKLAAGEFVVTVEMSPPRSFNAQKVLASAQMLRDAGVDCADISDSPMARMRMSPWAVCHLLQTRLEMDTILHFPTRGRNLLRVQGDLLAAHALNVRNLFVCMGDPTAIGDYPEAYDKSDIVPSGLIRLVKQNLNTGKDQAGNSIGQPTSFLVGCALNLCPQDIDAEIKTLRKKIEAGADFALTQTIFEPEKVRLFLARYEELHGPLELPLLAGILPLWGARHAAFLHNEVPGVIIPEPVMARIERAGETAPDVGVAIAVELMQTLGGMIQGAYLIPPFGKYEMAAEIVEAIRTRV